MCVCVCSGLAVGLDPEGYGNPDFCWISIYDKLLWSFAGPIAIVILVPALCLSLSPPPVSRTHPPLCLLSHPLTPVSPSHPLLCLLSHSLAPVSPTHPPLCLLYHPLTPVSPSHPPLCLLSPLLTLSHLSRSLSLRQPRLPHCLTQHLVSLSPVSPSVCQMNGGMFLTVEIGRAHV